MHTVCHTYVEGTAQITEKLSGKIKIMKGVRQGDTSSPVMSTAAVEEIFKRMNIEAGININGVRLSNLRFADDMILFAENEEKLKDMLVKCSAKISKLIMPVTLGSTARKSHVFCQQSWTVSYNILQMQQHAKVWAQQSVAGRILVM